MEIMWGILKSLHLQCQTARYVYQNCILYCKPYCEFRMDLYSSILHVYYMYILKLVKKFGHTEPKWPLLFIILKLCGQLSSSLLSESLPHVFSDIRPIFILYGNDHIFEYVISLYLLLNID